jgi:hypothetical protein
MGRRDGSKKFAASTNRRKFKFAKQAKDVKPKRGSDEKRAA